MVSKELPEKINEVLVTRREGDKFVVLGRTNNPKSDSRPYLYKIILDRTTYEIKEDQRWCKYNDSALFILPTLFTLGTYYFLPPVRKRADRDGDFDREVNSYWHANMEDLASAVEGIPIYQLTIDGAERYTGPLEVVETGNATKFVEADDFGEWKSLTLPPEWQSKDFWLRVRARELGADALVHYQAGSPARATPVRFRDKK